ncbi:MAG TPA: hypothetical protein VF627_01590, partial [Abditibacterium sp.]
MSIELVGKAVDRLEGALAAMATKADEEMKAIGKVSTDTKAALETLGTQQREIADRLSQVEQKGSAQPEAKADETWG